MDGGRPNHLPMALPLPPPHPACPPDFAATATRGCSHTFAIQAGLLLVCGAHRGAASTGSCSASKGFGQQGWGVAPAGRIGRGAILPRVSRMCCGISRVGVCRGALLLRVGWMRCGVGGVGVSRRAMLPRVGRLCCSVNSDNFCQWALFAAQPWGKQHWSRRNVALCWQHKL